MIKENISNIASSIPSHVQLVAVSKTKSVKQITEAYEAGQRDFGENYVQELIEKQVKLSTDIRWHFIGHLQSNKAKYIAPFVHLIHGVDSFKLLKEINKQAEKNNRVIDCLLQMHIAKEETKFGLDEAEIAEIINSAELNQLTHIRIRGLMGMASNTADTSLIENEFGQIQAVFNSLKAKSAGNLQIDILSTGMSSDYHYALKHGSTMVRIGSLIFGEREKI
ncbi:MAG: YggS family pyridoxal phosphate-dependent enzyme [Flavobacteriales bacterium]